MATIFLCYRREDSQDVTGRLYDHLVKTYGSERLFMDIETVPGGVDFVDHITRQMERCTAVIVVIGRSWSTMTDHRMRRKLDQPDDLVRAEIADALRRSLPVIPVLVQGASMPHADELPEDIRPLARRNAIELSHLHWREGVQRLLKALEQLSSPESILTSTPSAGKNLLSRMREAAAGTGVTVFALKDGQHAEEAFLERRRTQPNAYFATQARRAIWRLHRLHCSSLAFNGAQKLTASPKVFSQSDQEIREWARRFGVALTECWRCRKPKPAD